tara:strand:+ start:392 stop:745 length:354 start_codon:yes stop_codon:yes gene_type:complete
MIHLQVMKPRKLLPDVSAPIDVRAMVTPAGNGELRAPVAALYPDIISRTHRLLRIQQIFRVGSSVSKQIGNYEFIKTPVPGKPYAAPDRRIISMVVGSRWIKSDEKDGTVTGFPASF